jgi:hypothetical protein
MKNFGSGKGVLDALAKAMPPRELLGHVPTNTEGAPADYDPPKDRRRYFRNAQTGDLGYMVRRLGVDHIKYDRPYDDSTVKYRDGDWNEELHAEPMSRGQAVRAAFEADRVLCAALGLHVLAKKEWASLKPGERVDWLKNGPKGPDPRPILYAVIMKALEPSTRPE